MATSSERLELALMTAGILFALWIIAVWFESKGHFEPTRSCQEQRLWFQSTT